MLFNWVSQTGHCPVLLVFHLLPRHPRWLRRPVQPGIAGGNGGVLGEGGLFVDVFSGPVPGCLCGFASKALLQQLCLARKAAWRPPKSCGLPDRPRWTSCPWSGRSMATCKGRTGGSLTGSTVGSVLGRSGLPRDPICQGDRITVALAAKLALYCRDS